MSTWRTVLQRQPSLWAVPLGVLLIGLAGLALYRSNFAGESQGLSRRVEEKEQQVAAIERERLGLAAFVERAEVNHRLVEEFYHDRLATRRQRLTQVTEEIKSLARRAGLDPKAINYPESSVSDYALVERSFVFTVQGRYSALANFVNLLELSPSFLILERLELSGERDDPDEVRISLALSTLFARDEAAGGES